MKIFAKRTSKTTVLRARLKIQQVIVFSSPEKTFLVWHPTLNIIAIFAASLG